MDDGTASITGSVFYRERMALPPDAVVEVTLSDVARMDAAAELIGSTSFPGQGGPPFDFTIAYDPARITDRGQYALRATIRAEGRLMFTTTEHVPAFERDPSKPLMLTRVGAAPAPAPAPTQAPPTPPDASLVNTYWKLVELDGAPAALGVNGREAHLVLEREGSVHGFAGCNTFRGSFTTDGSVLKLGPLAVTMMACVDGMELEAALLAALDAVESFVIEGDSLALTDGTGVVRARMAAVYLG